MRHWVLLMVGRNSRMPPLAQLELDLVLYNAHVITFDRRSPAPELVGISGNRICYIGMNEDLPLISHCGTHVIDCEWQTLVPGFIDSHCHLFGYTSRQTGVDCSSKKLRNIADLQTSLAREAFKADSDYWIRGNGYDELDFAERRHPTRRDLDLACPYRPVKLDHRTGHATVLNSLGLKLVGIGSDSAEPDSGFIDREIDSGEPSGLLLEMNDWLDDRIPVINKEDFYRGLNIVNGRLKSYGITTVVDATVSNSTKRWELFQKIKSEDMFTPRITMMVGESNLREVIDTGSYYGSGNSNLNIGHAKIMLTSISGKPNLSVEQLVDTITWCHGVGFPVAIHAVEGAEVETASEALFRSCKTDDTPIPAGKDRIEHCSEASTAVIRQLKRSGTGIVTQPSFIYHNGDRYRQAVPKDRFRALYRIASMKDMGLRIGFSSDAPVVDPNPIIGISAAFSRSSAAGWPVVASQSVPIIDGLRMYSLEGARLNNRRRLQGSISVGKLADLALLNTNLRKLPPEQFAETHVTMTLIDGKVVYRE